jgi:hypothetical protein
MDPKALNNNPEVTVSDESCRYNNPEDTGDTGDSGNPGGDGGVAAVLPPPAQESVLIPVTGADLGGGLAGVQPMLRGLGMLFFGSAAMFEGVFRRKKR